MKSDIKLVLCDIDGTIVKTDRSMTKRTKDTIHKIHEHGYYFGLASGRPVDELSRNTKKWGLNFDFDILIGMNGAELKDGIHNKEYKYFMLKTEWLKEIMKLMAPFDLNPYIYYHGKMMCLKMDDDIRRSSKRNQKQIIIASDPSDMYAEENAKIMYRVKEEDAAAIEKYINEHPSPYYKAFKTQTTMIEFADRRISKANALKEFCKMNPDIPLSSIIAFGDATNDNEMLECSGIGVCMANGCEDTKEAADILTEKSNDEDGFADFVEKHLL